MYMYEMSIQGMNEWLIVGYKWHVYIVCIYIFVEIEGERFEFQRKDKCGRHLLCIIFFYIYVKRWNDFDMLYYIKSCWICNQRRLFYLKIGVK